MSIDVKKLLYKYPKLVVALANIQNSMNRLHKQYPSCTPRYSDEIQGRGGFPHSQTERLAFHNIVDIEEQRDRLEKDADEHQYVIGLIKTAVDTLDERQKEIVKLCYYEGKEPLMAANMMNLSLSRFYHLHTLTIDGIEQCLNSGNIYMNRLIPVKTATKQQKYNKKTGSTPVKTAV